MMPSVEEWEELDELTSYPRFVSVHL